MSSDVGELHNLNSSPNIIKTIEDEMGMAYSTHRGKRSVYRVLTGKPEGKRPRGRAVLYSIQAHTDSESRNKSAKAVYFIAIFRTAVLPYQ
jgi:hypothetical protein